MNINSDVMNSIEVCIDLIFFVNNCRNDRCRYIIVIRNDSAKEIERRIINSRSIELLPLSLLLL